MTDLRAQLQEGLGSGHVSLGPERFLREIQLAARLQHPRVLTVLDSRGTAGGNPRLAGGTA